MARRGRPRKAGSRQPDGRLVPKKSSIDSVLKTAELAATELAKREHLLSLGVDPEDRSITSIVGARRIAAGATLGDERASTPLGMMLALGLITEPLYLAGELYEKNQLRLGRHVAGPAQTRSHLANLLAEAAPAVYAGIDDGDDFKKQFSRCRWVEREITARVWDWRGLEALVVFHEPPEFFAAHNPTGGNAFHRLQVLRHDLGEVARFFERPPPREENRGPHPSMAGRGVAQPADR